MNSFLKNPEKNLIASERPELTIRINNDETALRPYRRPRITRLIFSYRSSK